MGSAYYSAPTELLCWVFCFSIKIYPLRGIALFHIVRRRPRKVRTASCMESSVDKCVNTSLRLAFVGSFSLVRFFWRSKRNEHLK